MPPSDPHHPQWPYRAGFQGRRNSFELQRRHQESNALAAQSAQHLSEMHRYRAWAQHYRGQNPDLAQAALCDQWAEYHRNWSVELGNRSKAAYNGWYTANRTTEITNPADWAAVNTDHGQLQFDVPAPDGRPYGHRGGLRPPLRQHQDDLVAAMPRNPDGTLQATPDPRIGRWFGLANDGGPSFDPTRGINCVDCMMSAWRTWRGRPQVAAPRTLDAYAGTDVNAAANGETGGMDRIAAQVGGQWQTVFPNMANQPAATAQQWSDWGFATITQQLQQAGHGSAMMIVTEWQGGNSHAWLAVNQGGTILFLDPQTGAISENVTLYGHDGNPANGSNVVGLHALMLDANGQAQDIAPLAQTPWGQAAQQAKLAQQHALAQQQAQQQALAQQQAQLVQHHAQPVPNAQQATPPHAHQPDAPDVQSPQSDAGPAPEPTLPEPGSARREIPCGFADFQEFQRFGAEMNRLLRELYPDVESAFQGSAVTGRSYDTGAAFDDGRVSDYDVALSGQSLIEAAQAAGIEFRSSGANTPPLTTADLEALGLDEIAEALSEAAGGRDVNFMIVADMAEAKHKKPSIGVWF